MAIALNIGQRFARLVLIAPVQPPQYAARGGIWRTRCDCGNEVITSRSKLLSGHTRSCGCLKSEVLADRKRTHGGTGTRLYATWLAMRNRCINPIVDMFYRYGGRGISVCDEWGTFEPFREWALANGYRDDLSIDRIDNDGNYEPSNCRWATPAEQSQNTSRSIMINVDGIKACLKAHTDRLGVPYGLVIARLRLGWDPEKALKLPVQKPVMAGGRFVTRDYAEKHPDVTSKEKVR